MKKILLIAAMLSPLSGCGSKSGGGGSTPAPEGPIATPTPSPTTTPLGKPAVVGKPAISEFTGPAVAYMSSKDAAKSVTLKWTSADTKNCRLVAGEVVLRDDLPAKGEVEVEIKETTLFQIKCLGLNSETVQRDFKLEVKPAAEILKAALTDEAGEALPGKALLLTWQKPSVSVRVKGQARGSRECKVDGQAATLDQDQNFDVPVEVKEAHTVQVSCVGGSGEDRRELPVQVDVKPAVHGFKVETNSAAAGSDVKFSWTRFGNAKACQVVEVLADKEMKPICVQNSDEASCVGGGGDKKNISDRKFALSCDQPTDVAAIQEQNVTFYGIKDLQLLYQKNLLPTNKTLYLETEIERAFTVQATAAGVPNPEECQIKFESLQPFRPVVTKGNELTFDLKITLKEKFGPAPWIADGELICGGYSTKLKDFGYNLAASTTRANYTPSISVFEISTLTGDPSKLSLGVYVYPKKNCTLKMNEKEIWHDENTGNTFSVSHLATFDHPRMSGNVTMECRYDSGFAANEIINSPVVYVNYFPRPIIGDLKVPVLYAGETPSITGTVTYPTKAGQIEYGTQCGVLQTSKTSTFGSSKSSFSNCNLTLEGAQLKLACPFGVDQRKDTWSVICTNSVKNDTSGQNNKTTTTAQDFLPLSTIVSISNATLNLEEKSQLYLKFNQTGATSCKLQMKNGQQDPVAFQIPLQKSLDAYSAVVDAEKLSSGIYEGVLHCQNEDKGKFSEKDLTIWTNHEFKSPPIVTLTAAGQVIPANTALHVNIPLVSAPDQLRKEIVINVKVESASTCYIYQDGRDLVQTITGENDKISTDVKFTVGLSDKSLSFQCINSIWWDKFKVKLRDLPLEINQSLNISNFVALAISDGLVKTTAQSIDLTLSAGVNPASARCDLKNAAGILLTKNGGWKTGSPTDISPVTLGLGKHTLTLDCSNTLPGGNVEHLVSAALPIEVRATPKFSEIKIGTEVPPLKALDALNLSFLTLVKNREVQLAWSATNAANCEVQAERAGQFVTLKSKEVATNAYIYIPQDGDSRMKILCRGPVETETTEHVYQLTLLNPQALDTKVLTGGYQPQTDAKVQISFQYTVTGAVNCTMTPPEGLTGEQFQVVRGQIDWSVPKSDKTSPGKELTFMFTCTGGRSSVPEQRYFSQPLKITMAEEFSIATFEPASGSSTAPVIEDIRAPQNFPLRVAFSGEQATCTVASVGADSTGNTERFTLDSFKTSEVPSPLNILVSSDTRHIEIVCKNRFNEGRNKHFDVTPKPKKSIQLSLNATTFNMKAADTTRTLTATYFIQGVDATDKSCRIATLNSDGEELLSNSISWNIGSKVPESKSVSVDRSGSIRVNCGDLEQSVSFKVIREQLITFFEVLEARTGTVTTKKIERITGNWESDLLTFYKDGQKPILDKKISIRVSGYSKCKITPALTPVFLWSESGDSIQVDESMAVTARFTLPALYRSFDLEVDCEGQGKQAKTTLPIRFARFVQGEGEAITNGDRKSALITWDAESVDNCSLDRLGSSGYQRLKSNLPAKGSYDDLLNSLDIGLLYRISCTNSAIDGLSTSMFVAPRGVYDLCMTQTGGLAEHAKFESWAKERFGSRRYNSQDCWEAHANRHYDYNSYSLLGLSDIKDEELEMSAFNDQNLVHLGRLTQLKKLKMSLFVDGALQSEWISRLKNLKSLDLSYAKLANGVTFLKSMPDMEIFKLYSVNPLSGQLDFSPLKGLTHLRTLDIAGYQNEFVVADPRYLPIDLTDLNELETVRLVDLHMSQFPGLADLKGLKSLNLRGNKIESLDLIGEKPLLTELWLDELNGISNFTIPGTVDTQFPLLESLSIGVSRIYVPETSVVPLIQGEALGHLVRLKSLWLGLNLNDDGIFSQNFASLQSLTLDASKLTNVDHALDLPALKGLSLPPTVQSITVAAQPSANQLPMTLVSVGSQVLSFDFLSQRTWTSARLENNKVVTLDRIQQATIQDISLQGNPIKDIDQIQAFITNNTVKALTLGANALEADKTKTCNLKAKAKARGTVVKFAGASAGPSFEVNWADCP